MVPFSLNLNCHSDQSSPFKFGLQFCGVTPKKVVRSDKEFWRLNREASNSINVRFGS